MTTILIAIILIGLAVTGFAVKILFQKNGEFKKVCSSSLIDPKTGKPMSCSCGDESTSKCDNKHHH